MRITDWRVPFLFLVLCAIAAWSWADTQSPILVHQDNANQREFQNVYQSINVRPVVFSGSGASTATPRKIGDIYIDTSAGKVYISTSAVSAGGWALLN